MANVKALSKEHHSSLTVMTDYKRGFGYDRGVVMVFPSEIREAQREYPILFRKHPETGEFIPNVLLGFEQDENLFLDEEKGSWGANYIPMAMEKGPFLIGHQKNDTQEDLQAPLIYYIDEDDPRVGSDFSQQIFKNENLSPHMEKVSQILLAMHEGWSVLSDMVNTFKELDIIEALSLSIQFKNEEPMNFEGAYTIAEEKLLGLSDNQLALLNKKGYLSLAYYIADSLRNIDRLIDRKNAKI